MMDRVNFIYNGNRQAVDIYRLPVVLFTDLSFLSVFSFIRIFVEQRFKDLLDIAPQHDIGLCEVLRQF